MNNLAKIKHEITEDDILVIMDVRSLIPTLQTTKEYKKLETN